jgi:hypothetical protein
LYRAEKEIRVSSLNEWADRINKCAADHGFWPEEGRNFGEMIALAHSELSEGLEEHRSGNPPFYWKCKECDFIYSADTLPEESWHYVRKSGFIGKILKNFGVRLRCEGSMKPEGTAIELLDCIIRCLDTMRSLDVDIDNLMEVKVSFNEKRPHKHGRAY